MRFAIASKVTFGARDYDPSVGRWVSKEPILFDGDGVNLYRYAGNDPVNFRDPSGRFLVVAVGIAAEAWAAWQLYKAKETYDEATRDALNQHGNNLWNTPGDAYKHCLASCLVAQRQGETMSRVGGELNEIKGDICQNQPAAERQMDEINNAMGRSFSNANCYSECAAGLSNGLLQTAP